VNLVSRPGLVPASRLTAFTLNCVSNLLAHVVKATRNPASIEKRHNLCRHKCAVVFKAPHAIVVMIVLCIIVRPAEGTIILDRKNPASRSGRDFEHRIDPRQPRLASVDQPISGTDRRAVHLLGPADQVISELGAVHSRI